MKNIKVFQPQIKKYTYNPQKWSNKYGKPCPICNQKIRLSRSISVCQCPLFSHHQCFLLNFPKEYSEGSTITCKDCKHQIQLIYETDIPLTVIALILGIVSVIMLTQANQYLNKKKVEVRTFLLTYITVLSAFCLSIMLMLIRRQRVLTYVKSTQKSMKISMLDEIESESNIRSIQIYALTQQSQKAIKRKRRNS